MKNLMQTSIPGPENTREGGFHGFKEAPDRPANHQKDPVLEAPSLFHSPERAREGFTRFCDARESLRQYGATIDVKENPGGGMVLTVDLSFPTNHEVLDTRLYEMVSGMGFSLSLKSVPVAGVTVHTYCIREGHNADIGRADSIAEDLLKLASLMAPLVIRKDERKQQVPLDTPAPVLLRVLEPIRVRDPQEHEQEPAVAAVVAGVKPSP